MHNFADPHIAGPAADIGSSSPPTPLISLCFFGHDGRVQSAEKAARRGLAANSENFSTKLSTCFVESRKTSTKSGH
ncbi:protein of unknown function [Burkholderia multivorans]